MHPLRRWAAGLAVLALVPLLAACGSDDGGSSTASADSPAKAVIGTTRDPQHSVQISVAEALGYFRDERVDVTVKRFPTGPEVSQAVAAGDVQFFSGTAIPQWTLVGAGTEIEILSQLGESSNAQGLVGREDVRTPRDLEGKKVALIPATSLEAFYRAVVEAYDLDESKITTVTLDGPGMLTALEKGDVDAAFLFMPWMVNAERVGGHKVLTGTRSHVPGEAPERVFFREHAVFLGDPSFVEGNPKTVERVLRALARAQAFIEAEPARTAEIMAGVLRFDEADVQRMLAANRYQLTLDDQLVEDFTVAGDFLEQAGRLRDLPSVETWLDPEPLRTVQPEAVTLR